MCVVYYIQTIIPFILVTANSISNSFVLFKNRDKKIKYFIQVFLNIKLKLKLKMYNITMRDQSNNPISINLFDKFDCV